MRNRLVALVAGLISLGYATTLVATEPQSFMGGEYRADTPFPEFMPLWREGWSLRDDKGDLIRYAKPDMPLGGYVHAFIRNTSDAALEIADISLNGISLSQALVSGESGKNRDASSILFAKLSADQMKTLLAIGEPVWWKADPFTVPAKGTAEIVVRLRRSPQVDRIALIVPGKGSGEIKGEIAIKQKSPRIVSIGFSPKCDQAYIYLQHPDSGTVPESLHIDGEDVTAKSSFASDRNLPLVPAVVTLNKPVNEGEFHLIEAGYADGSTARSSIRVDRPDFVYGMWGGFSMNKIPDNLEAEGAAFIEHLRSHNINTIMEQYGRSVRDYANTSAGQAMCAKYGIRIMDHNPSMFPNQRYVFLKDEPDAKDIRAEQLPLDKRIGTCGQWLVGIGRKFRAQSPLQLQLLNIDNTFRPENWYSYAQLPDIPCADPYYQAQLRSVYLLDPGFLPVYTKPTYVYAVGAIYSSACAPKPMHLILNSVRTDAAEPQFCFRAPTPEEKRVELYYSIAAGARGISFWWYAQGQPAHGVGSKSPEMQKLFAEIGLVGAEILTAEPVLSRACPVQMDLQASPMVWARALLAGNDSLVLVITSNNIASDKAGTTVQPLSNARLSLQPPAWLKAKDTFEVTSSGIKDVSTETQDAKLTVELNRVDLTRLIIVTADPQLRTQLQQRFDTHFAENSRKLLAEAGPREVKQLDKSQEKAVNKPPKKKKKGLSHPAQPENG